MHEERVLINPLERKTIIHEVDDFLPLKGLKIIYQRNISKKK